MLSEGALMILIACGIALAGMAWLNGIHPDTEQDDLRRGFAECWRVLAPGGTLIFKWAGKIERVKPHFPATPIVGTRVPRGLQTWWLTFYKPLQPQPQLLSEDRTEITQVDAANRDVWQPKPKRPYTRADFERDKAVREARP